jgi:hypothetical protein
MSRAYVISNDVALEQYTAGRLIATTDAGRLKVADDLDVKTVLSDSLGSAGGIATLDDSGHVPSEQLANVGFPSTKGTLIVGDGTDSIDLDVGADRAILRANSATQSGLEWDVAGVDHLTDVTNAGTNTHAQLDAFVASKGQIGGIASLDGTGNVPLVQLGNVPTLPTIKGVIITGNGSASTNLTIGANTQSIVADSTTATGLKWAQIDHVNLASKGTNTHAQIDTFIASKGAASGLATLDVGGQVPLTQLGNVPAGVTLPTTKGVLITGNGSASTNLAVGASNNQLLTVDATTATGLKWAQGDHTTLANIGTNTHAQLDTFVASKGAANGLASLDGTGKVPTGQLPTFSTYTPPVTKGILTTGNGSAATTLPVGVSNNQLLTVDSTAATGIKWAQGDHTTLSNIGTNTHAQLDTFVASKGSAGGLATLDGTGNVPLVQLGNVPAGVTLTTTKGVIITGNGSASANLTVGTNNQLLTADSTAPNGIKWAQGDHTALSSVGTNTHAQIDTFIASKGANSGVASLDGAGQVPSAQLGNVVKPVTKGQILVGNGTVPTALGVGTNNQLLVADSAQATGVKWAQGDHTTLSNVGSNTHAQLDTFVASKGAANGLATLDSGGQVPASQLGNAPSGVAAGTLVTNTFTGAGTFDLWSRTLATAGSAIGVATEAFVAANQGVLAKTGTWLLLHTVGSSLGIPDTSTPAGVVVSTQAGSDLTGTSAQFAVTSGNGAGINGDVILRVTQDRTTTWTAIVRSISSNVTP